MFRLVSAFVLAALVTAFIVDRPATGDDSSAVALAATRTITRIEPQPAAPLGDYVGVYETADGATFLVAREGESFTISLPETVALPIRAVGPGFAFDASLMQISFEADANGVRLVLAGTVADPVVATRVTLPRGVVTVHDII